MSHLSIESLSHMYNQNLRLKFGSAPAQLLSIGEQAEKSMEKRASILKTQFDLNNIVNTKSQLSNHLSKQAMQGTLSSISWAKCDEKSKNANQSARLNANNKSAGNGNNKNGNQSIRYEEESEESSDEDVIINNKNSASNKYSSSKKNRIGSISSRDTGRISNASSNIELNKFY